MFFDKNKHGAKIDYLFSVPDNLKIKANTFAQESNKRSGNKYSKDRLQSNADARIEQCINGKFGEVATVEYLKDKVDIERDVDWNIYEEWEKNFSSDIFVNDGGQRIRISCKLSMYPRMGYSEKLDGTAIKQELPIQHSYVYQLHDKSGKGGNDNGEHDVYVFINKEKDGMVRVYAWVWASYISKMLVSPFKHELRGIKACIMQKTCCLLDDFPCGIDELISGKKYLL